MGVSLECRTNGMRIATSCGDDIPSYDADRLGKSGFQEELKSFNIPNKII